MNCIAKRLQQVFEQNKHRTAYIHQNETLSYQTLLDKARKYSALLKKQGSGPVMIYGHKEPEVLISIVACLFANRAYVPVDTCTPVSRLKEIVQACQASLILSSALREEMPAKVSSLEMLEDIVEEAAALACDGIHQDGIHDGINGINIEETEENQQTAYIIFTSGSTGQAKGVPISYQNLNNFISWIGSLPPLEKADGWTILNQASFSFDLSVADLYFSLSGGHTLAVLDRDLQQDPAALMEEIQRVSPDMMVCTPLFLNLCLLSPQFSSKHLPHLHAVFSCGETLPPATARRLLRRFEKLQLVNAYGPTEACCAVTGCLITPQILETEGALPVGDMNWRALDISVENREIVLKGESVSRGYLNADASRFFEEDSVRGYRTGDYGRIENGLLYFGGRCDRQIKFRGHRIELEDIENNLLALKEVGACAVCALTSFRGGVGGIKAVVELTPAALETLEEGADPLEDIQKKLAARLPGYMMPTQFEWTHSLPKNCNGKIDRKKLFA